MKTIRELIKDFATELISKDALKEKIEDYIALNGRVPSDDDLERLHKELLNDNLDQLMEHIATKYLEVLID